MNPSDLIISGPNELGNLHSFLILVNLLVVPADPKVFKLEVFNLVLFSLFFPHPIPLSNPSGGLKNNYRKKIIISFLVSTPS